MCVARAAEALEELDLTHRATVAAAVSGGSDSTALLLLLKDHLARHAPHVGIVVITVDHGLRAGSAAEAASVARLCAELGIAHRTETWRGDKPASGIAATAREARYRLLAQAAIDAGTDIILTGHTREDQAETVAMRQARSESGHGLSAMAPATLYDERVWIVRPLLDARRAELRAFLSARAVGWIEDPSNRDQAHERVRRRIALAGAPGEIDRLALSARTAGRERQALSKRTARLAGEIVTHHGDLLMRVDADRLAAAEPDAALHLLRTLAAIAGGRAHLSDDARSRVLMGRLLAGPSRATLSRALVERRGGFVWLCRETRDLPTLLAAGRKGIWDGRWRWRRDDAGSDPVIGPRPAEVEAAEPAAKDGPSRALLRAARRAMPHVEGGAREISLRPFMAPFSHFLTLHDLPLASAVARILGAEEFPVPPLRNHNAP